MEQMTKIVADIRSGMTSAQTGTGMSTKALDVNNVASNVTKWLSWGIGVISIVFIVIGGIKFATSSGDEKKVETAKKTIIYAVIGLAVAVLAYAIATIVSNLASDNGGST
jgi:hypothetical protein